jgi:hypothetical protein
MEDPRERFIREAIKAAATQAGWADPTVMEAVRKFNEARAKEREPSGPQSGSK